MKNEIQLYNDALETREQMIAHLENFKFKQEKQKYELKEVLQASSLWLLLIALYTIAYIYKA